jgi:hypothetical protein
MKWARMMDDVGVRGGRARTAWTMDMHHMGTHGMAVSGMYMHGIGVDSLSDSPGFESRPPALPKWRSVRLTMDSL